MKLRCWVCSALAGLMIALAWAASIVTPTPASAAAGAAPAPAPKVEVKIEVKGDVKVEAKPPAPAKPEPTPVVPTETVKLFNGKDLTGLSTWLQDLKGPDNRGVFTVKDGVLVVSGDGFGYVITDGAYKDYHLVVEYRWGPRTWRSRAKATKDSGIILHCTGPDGNSGAWMAGIECQIIQGGTGDFIIVNGKGADGKAIPVGLTAEVAYREKNGKRVATVWQKGGEKKVFKGGRIDWYGRDPEWKDVLGFRGKDDVESPDVEGEAGWTRVECICDGGRITNIVNGKVVNEGWDSIPSAGRILLQTEGAEIHFRRFELLPLKKDPAVKAPETK